MNEMKRRWNENWFLMHDQYLFFMVRKCVILQTYQGGMQR